MSNVAPVGHHADITQQTVSSTMLVHLVGASMEMSRRLQA